LYFGYYSASLKANPNNVSTTNKIHIPFFTHRTRRNNMISPQLIATLDKLPPAIQTEILNYAEYLASKYTQTPATSSPKYRQAGTMKRMFTMADDFDAP
jgi:Protein of unknown function (DUF2281)